MANVEGVTNGEISLDCYSSLLVLNEVINISSHESKDQYSLVASAYLDDINKNLKILDPELIRKHHHQNQLQKSTDYSQLYAEIGSALSRKLLSITAFANAWQLNSSILPNTNLVNTVQQRIQSLNNMRMEQHKLELEVGELYSKFVNSMLLILQELTTKQLIILRDHAPHVIRAFTTYHERIIRNASLKLKCLKLEMLLKVYDKSTTEALQLKMDNLNSTKQQVQFLHSANIKPQLEVFMGLGEEFDSLVKSYSTTLQNIDLVIDQVKRLRLSE